MVSEILIQNKIETITFEIEQPVHSIWIKADFADRLGVMIFLYNPDKQLCGLITVGYNNFVKEIYISDTVCTKNGLYHKLQAGIYTVMLVPFYDTGKVKAKLLLTMEQNLIKTYEEQYCQSKLPEPELSFTSITEETCRYYKGDFHGHTIFSDGHNTLKEAADILKKQGLDFMAFTEHNCMPFGFTALPCLSIPSFELTLPIGHINIHGVRNLALLYEQLSQAQNYEDILELALDFFSDDNNVSLNHMFMEPWHFTYEEFDVSKLNTIEVICDPTYAAAAKSNDKAALFLDFLWNRGFTIYGIGGSDSHNKINEFYEGSAEPSIYGDPATYVYCKGLSVRNVLEGVQQGHCYTSRYITLDININGGKYLPGDQIKEEGEIIYQIRIDKIKKPLKGCFIRNGNIVKEVLLNENQEEAVYSVSSPDEAWWLRFGVYDMEGHVIAYVNPIYNKRIKANKVNFKTLREEFGEIYDQRYTV
ncbi:MAG: CehA/McbA family metallohydrolase [Anaerocolumna sp.]